MGRFSKPARGGGNSFANSPPLWFYEGKCQEKIFPRRAEAGREFVLAFSPHSRALPVRCDVAARVTGAAGYGRICSDADWSYSVLPALRSRVIADHREAVGGRWFPLPAFPLSGKVLFRTARSRQGRADRRGGATP